jgi:hypothetical protein
MSKLANIVDIEYKRDANFWELNPQLAHFPGFAELHNTDGGKEDSSKQAWCVVFYSEPDYTQNRFYRMSEQERKSTLREYLYKDIDWDSDLIQNAILTYNKYCLSPVKRALKEEIDSASNRSEYIRSYDYSKNDLDNNRKMDLLRKNTPAIMDNYSKLEKQFLEEETTSRVYGGRRESKAERKIL